MNKLRESWQWVNCDCCGRITKKNMRDILKNKFFFCCNECRVYFTRLNPEHPVDKGPFRKVEELALLRFLASTNPGIKTPYWPPDSPCKETEQSQESEY